MERLQQIKGKILETCQKASSDWNSLTVDDLTFAHPKGFSSITTLVSNTKGKTPTSIFYRELMDKTNSILPFELEKKVFLAFGDSGVATKCLYYDNEQRLEETYVGRSLTADDLFNKDNLKQIADQLYKLHTTEIEGLPDVCFFELLFNTWKPQVRDILENQYVNLPENEQKMCIELREIYSDATLQKVMGQIPEGPLSLSHNDTYHGNIMKLDNGEIKLLDFEFSCKNNIAYDFANLFAETQMEHGLKEYPYFKIIEPRFTDDDLLALINPYLDNFSFTSEGERETRRVKLLKDTKQMIKLSDFMYSMAGITLSMVPIQKLRFIPYAYQRFHKFLSSTSAGSSL